MQRKKMEFTGHCTSRIRNHFRRHITGRSEHIIRDYRSSQNVLGGICGSPAVKIVKSLIVAWDGEFEPPLSSSTQKRSVAIFQHLVVSGGIFTIALPSRMLVFRSESLLCPSCGDCGDDCGGGSGGRGRGGGGGRRRLGYPPGGEAQR